MVIYKKNSKLKINISKTGQSSATDRFLTIRMGQLCGTTIAEFREFLRFFF